MTDTVTANGHDATGGLDPPVTRPRVVKDPTAASRARRYRDNKRKAAGANRAATEKANDFKSRVTVRRHAGVAVEKVGKSKSVTPSGQPRWHIADVAAYAAAIGLAGCAAWFSIRGMTVLFPGAPLAIIAMAATMETAKLITAGWLARRWRATAVAWRLALMAFVVGLAVINAGGTYSQLVAAHVGEKGAAQARLETQAAELDARIEVAGHAVADFDRRLGQIDSAIEEAAKRGRTNAALSAIDGQRRTRAGLVDERNRAAGTLAALKAGRASLAARGRQVQVEAAPIRYVAELVGADADSEQVIRLLIALMVVCCDPLAIALTAAVAGRA
jgi:hypothetical protein